MLHETDISYEIQSALTGRVLATTQSFDTVLCLMRETTSGFRQYQYRSVLPPKKIVTVVVRRDTCCECGDPIPPSASYWQRRYEVCTACDEAGI